jgi:hypothetical protein
MEKQRDKAARRVQRKAEKLSGDSPNALSDDDLGEPLDGPAPLDAAGMPETVRMPAVE